jgi:hypothetical protein
MHANVHPIQFKFPRLEDPNGHSPREKVAELLVIFLYQDYGG